MLLHPLDVGARQRRKLATIIAVSGFALVVLPRTSGAQEHANPVPLDTTALHAAYEPPPPKEDTSAFRTAAIVTIAGNVFDSVTTIAGMQSGGVREINPVLGQHPGRIVLLKSLLVIPVLLAEKKLVDNGHPKIARFVGYAVGGFASTLAIHNIRTSR